MLLSQISENQIGEWGNICKICGGELSNNYGLRVHLGMEHPEVLKYVRGETHTLSVEDRMKLYNEAIRLHKENGWGKIRIARKLGLSVNCVKHWLYEGTIPENEWCYIPNKVDLEPSESLSYVIGVYCGDGCVSKGVIRLQVIDKEFVEEFRRCMLKIISPKLKGVYPIFEVKPKQENRRIQYAVAGCSSTLGNFLKGGINKYKECVSKYPAEFLRGLFDSEGCFRHRQHSNRNYTSWCNEITCEMSDRLILEYARELLDSLGIESRIRKSGEKGRKNYSLGCEVTATKPIYKLWISSKDNLIKFKEKVGSSIERKQRTLIEIADSYT